MRAGEADGSPAFGAQHADMARKARDLHLRSPMVLEHGGDEVELHVGQLDIGQGPCKPARFGERRGQPARTRLAPFEQRLEPAPLPPQRHVVEQAAAGLIPRDIVDMVLEVAADGGPIDDDGHAHRAEMFGRTDPRQHQQLRGVERPRREHDRAAGPDRARLAPTLADYHAHRAPLLDQDALDQSAGLDVQPTLGDGGLDIGACRRPAFAALLRGLVKPHTLEMRAVEVGIARQLERGGGFDEFQAPLMRPALVADVERPAAAVPRVRAALVMLGAFEPRQHVLVRPAGRAQSRPIVVIPRCAADIYHRVDRRRSAESTPAWLKPASPVQPRLRHRFIAIVRL